MRAYTPPYWMTWPTSCQALAKLFPQSPPVYKVYLILPYYGLENLRVNATIILFVFVLYCIVFYCIVLYCIVLYCIVLYCIVLYCIVLYCIVLYCIVLYCIVLYCILSIFYLYNYFNIFSLYNFCFNNFSVLINFVS